ncbi:hypothetical protein V8G54_031976 [Vigna mungo]|uniref:Uncharacterized protein n=1 Tax=Vigna mungo TaxID=3915 RepID=A0AAQ3MLD8_VIGMU
MHNSNEPLNGGASLTRTDSPPISPSHEFDDVVKELKSIGLGLEPCPSKVFRVYARSHSGLSSATPSIEELQSQEDVKEKDKDEVETMMTTVKVTVMNVTKDEEKQNESNVVMIMMTDERITTMDDDACGKFRSLLNVCSALCSI